MNPATMRRLATSIGIVSLLAALVFTGMLIKNASSGKKPADSEEVTIVYPTVQINSHEPLSSQSGKFLVKRMEKDKVNADALRSLDELDGKYALKTLPANNYVLKTDIGTAADLGVLSAVVRPGYRAITVPTDRLSVINGALKPNDYVDVLGSTERNGETISRVVLQNVRVLMVGAEVLTSKQPTGGAANGEKPADAPEKTTVTLEVHPEDAVKLFLAQSKGKLQMVLRGLGNAASVSVPPMKDTQVFPDNRPTPIAAAPPARSKSTTFKPVPDRMITYSQPITPATPQQVVPALPPSTMIYPPAVRQMSQPAEHVVTIQRGNDTTTQSFKQ